LRSALQTPASTLPIEVAKSLELFGPRSSRSSTGAVKIIAPGPKLPGLTTPQLKLLRKKQRRLEADASYTFDSLRNETHLTNALKATLIFAQYEAGTAVCIDAKGSVLTCSHCFGENEKEWMANRHKWLLFFTGLAVQVECQVWDRKRDLALCQIIALETSNCKDGEYPIFPFVPLSSQPPATTTSIVCFGQPGSDDLESTYARRTNYNLVEVSRGAIRGLVPGADPQDNLELGTLKHDAWTYWGHSGAPLLREMDGTLVGLHSSWDDETGMRHGIPQVAIKEFLRLHLPIVLGVIDLTTSPP
jgi:hypothetical protein